MLRLQDPRHRKSQSVKPRLAALLLAGSVAGLSFLSAPRPTVAQIADRFEVEIGQGTRQACDFAVVDKSSTLVVKSERFSKAVCRLRRNVNTFSAAEIDALRDGIRVMQDRDPLDPTSWLYQANIHGTTDVPALLAWNSCQHGSWYFLSWHRMYLYYLERILRDAVGDPDFALPYWDYSAGTASARQIPEPYRQPADMDANPLFVELRNFTMNEGGTLPESSVSLTALGRVNFSSAAGSGLSFGGQRAGPGHFLGPPSELESTPHNVIHGNVGGWMGSFNFAARDPVFWLHHCNIDRLWESWLAAGGTRSNPTAPAGDPWLNEEFDFYDIASQSFVTFSGKEILDTVGQLGYLYAELSSVPVGAFIEEEAEPATLIEEKAEEQEPRVLADIDATGTTLRNDPVSLSLEVVEVEDEDEGELVLRLEEVEIEAMPTGHYEVYVNLPEWATPEYTSVHFVGNMAFFGLAPRGQTAHHGEPGGAVYTYSLAALERHLKARGSWSGKIEVTFVKTSPEPPPGVVIVVEEDEAAVHIGRVKVTRE